MVLFIVQSLKISYPNDLEMCSPSQLRDEKQQAKKKKKKKRMKSQKQKIELHLIADLIWPYIGKEGLFKHKRQAMSSKPHRLYMYL